MKLVIGGYAQGKLDFVLANWSVPGYAVWDGALPGHREEGQTLILDRFHSWVKRRILEGGCPEEEILAFLDRWGDCIIISDEVGSGIVPNDPFEREYRERVGRILIKLAARAERVERVICGIGQRIK